MRNEIANLPQPMKAYFDKLLDLKVEVNYNQTDVAIGRYAGGIGFPPLEPQEAHELAKRMNEVIMPIIQEFTAMKLAQVLGIQVTHEQSSLAPHLEQPAETQQGCEIIPIIKKQNVLKTIMDRLF